MCTFLIVVQGVKKGNTLLKDTIKKEGNKTVLGRFAARSAWSLLFQATATGLGFISVTLMARWLGADEYGRYTYVATWVLVCSKLISALFDRLLVRQTAYYETLHTPALALGLFRTALIFTVSMSALVSACSAAAYFWGSDLQSGRLWLIAMAGLPFSAILSNTNSFIQGNHRVLSAQIAEMCISPLLWLMCLVLLYYVICPWGGTTFSAEWAAAGNLAVAFIVLLIGIALLWPSIKPLIGLRPTYDFEGWRKSGVWFFLSTALFLINNRADLLLLGYFSNNKAVGVYKVAVILSEILKLPLIAVNSVLLPQIALYFARNEIDDLQKLVKHSARISTAVAIIIAALLITLSPYLLQFYGTAYNDSYKAMLILCAGQLVNVASGSVGNILNMTKHDRDVFIGLAISTGSNILINVWLIPSMGYMGAACAAAISTILWNILLVALVFWRLRINPTVF